MEEMRRCISVEWVFRAAIAHVFENAAVKKLSRTLQLRFCQV